MSKEHSREAKENITRFGKLLADLARSGVDYAVVGGLSVIFNGYDRLTLDADILIDPSPENVGRLLRYLSGWGEGWARELKVEDFLPQEGSIRVMEEFDLDIFTQMRGKKLNDFRSRLKTLKIGDAEIRYLAPVDLIELKKDSWRDKDKMDVIAMREVMEREGKRRK